MKQRLIVGISGASGIIYGIRLLEILRGVEDIETHLRVFPTWRGLLVAKLNETMTREARTRSFVFSPPQTYLLNVGANPCGRPLG